jgi:hypothetical protein
MIRLMPTTTFNPAHALISNFGKYRGTAPCLVMLKGQASADLLRLVDAKLVALEEESSPSGRTQQFFWMTDKAREIRRAASLRKH